MHASRFQQIVIYWVWIAHGYGLGLSMIASVVLALLFSVLRGWHMSDFIHTYLGENWLLHWNEGRIIKPKRHVIIHRGMIRPANPVIAE